MKKYLLSIILFSIAIHALAQFQGDGGIPATIALNHTLSQAPLISFPKPDIKALQKEDAITEEKGDGPWRFGFNHHSAIDLASSALAQELPNGGKIYLLKIEAKNAQTINLTFENTIIPEGNELFVYDPLKTFILGKFTQKHLYKGQLVTELIPGSTAVVEYYVAPENAQLSPSVHIELVTHGYRSATEFVAKAFGSSGSCHTNINCPDGADWQTQKRGVLMIVVGSNGWCSGSLINNTALDEKPYVLTANHCYQSGYASWLFRFNWESAICSNPSSEPSFQSLSGGVIRARRTPSDFMLLEITGGLENNTVPTSYNPHFNGWDRSGELPVRGTGIHHPKGDIKKISFDDHLIHPTNSTISGVPSEQDGVWQVYWDRNTTTEGVSSGSPLFDQDKRIVGQLWGGQASCSALTGADYYGRIYSSWNPEGSDSSKQLHYWLNPINGSTTVLDGMDLGGSLALDAAIVHGTYGLFCSTSGELFVSIANIGTSTISSVTIEYGLNGDYSNTYTYSSTINTMDQVIITLPTIAITGGNHIFNARIASINGTTDDNLSNNVTSSNLLVMEDPQTITLTLNLDCYAKETEWRLYTEDDQEIVRSHAYTNDDAGTKTYTFCLQDGCYKFKIIDLYADGMTGCTSGNGSFVIRNASNQLLTEMPESEANFGSELVKSFCIGPLGIETLEQRVTVYPNPTKGFLAWQGEMVESIAVIDVNGRTILQTSTSSTTGSIDLKNCAEGVYICQFTLKNGQNVMKRIVLAK